MTAIGSGYDLSASIYSPEGRIFQVEYAAKAVEQSGTAIGLRCKDGIVLAVEKLVLSKLVIPSSNRRIETVDVHIGVVTAGLLADGRHIVKRARQEAQNYRSFYRVPVPGKAISDRVGQYVAAHTLYSSVRPFGATCIMGVLDEDGPNLYMIEPSGLYWGYWGCTVGKGKQVAKTEIEKLKLEELTVREAVKEAARIIHSAHEDSKDKEYELELSWISQEETGGVHQHVPKEVQEEAEEYAKRALDDAMEEDE